MRRPILLCSLHILCSSVLLAGAPPDGSEAGKPDKPLDLELRESAKVRVAIVDVVVLDRKGKTVSDLTAADFEITVGGNLVPVASLDVNCPEGAVDDPRGTSWSADLTPLAASATGQKLVIALDYQHLNQMQRAQVLDQAQGMIERGAGAGDDVMVAALTGGLRIEQPFSRDRERTRATLRRMDHDITLWNGHFDHITETGFVRGMSALFDVLGTVSGPKAVVLYSTMGSEDKDGSLLDIQFQQIAALAAGAQCSLYPVDARGLVTDEPVEVDRERPDPAVEIALTPTGTVAGIGLGPLARLATDSGGRFTERQNDFSVGFRRALRDQSCIYSVGFYDHSPEEDRAKSVDIRVTRPGLRVVHRSAYVFRSPKAKQESILRAAYLSPEMFDAGALRAYLFPIRPATNDSWEGLLAVSFPVPLAGTGGIATERDFGAMLLQGHKVIHSFQRRITLQPANEKVSASPVVTFLERVTVQPGKYSVTAVATDPNILGPQATGVQIDVPDIPRSEFFLAGPILGRRAGADVVVRGNQGGGAGVPPGTAAPSSVVSGVPAPDAVGDASSFQPLLIQDVAGPTDLVALTQACFVGKGARRRPSRLARSLVAADGSAVGTFEPIPIELEGSEKIRCQSFLDVLPARATSHGGEFMFGASLEPAPIEGVAPERVRFSVTVPSR